MEQIVMYQMLIPADLSEERYISGMEALNLPAPEGTSGDWHFVNVFYTKKQEKISRVTIAGNGEKIDTNPIWGNYGVYICDNALQERGLQAEGKISYAANHFRAILDLLYARLKENKYPFELQRVSEDFLDTNEEKNTLLEKAKEMRPYLSTEQQSLLTDWIEREMKPGW